MPMTPERAKEIAQFIHKAGYWKDNCTTEEKIEVNAFWAKLPGTYSFSDAVNAMARGVHLDPRCCYHCVNDRKLYRPGVGIIDCPHCKFTK